MNKVILTLLVGIMLIGSAYAKVGSIDTECTEKGFDFGIAKWEWDDEGEVFIHAEGDISGYATSVTGTASSASWTSTPAAAGILSKEALSYQVLPGGTSGVVNKVSKDISHITFCGTNNQIPEFGIMTALLGIIGAAGIVFLVRRN